MTITWKLGDRVLSDNEHYILKVGGEEVKVPIMFKIGTKNGEELYGYLDHEKLGGLSHTLIYYVLKKCFYGVGLVGGEEQGVVRTDRGVYKLRLFSLGDSRIASDTTWQDNSGKHKLILFDKVYNHKEQEALYDNKKAKTPQAIYEKPEDEAKDDVGAKAVPSSISAEGFIRYTQAYDSELLRLVLEDQELYKQMFEQDGPTHLVITSLLKMFLPDGKGSRHIAAIQQEGITEQKWEHFFRIALQKASPGTLESISPGISFALLELIVRGDHRPARLLLNENAEWREGFGLLLVNWHQNPLRLFSSYFEVNEEAKTVDNKEAYNTRQTIDSELFEELVKLNPRWLLETEDAKGDYFKRLAIYLKTHQDPILHSVFTSNLPLLHTKLQRATHLEALTLHFLNQEPVDLEYCEYLGLRKGFSSLAKPFQMSTNKLIVLRIKAAESLEEKLYLLEFFFPCLGLNGKGAVLQHLIEPSTINTCDQAVIKLFDEISSDLNLFAARSKQYLDNNGNNWQIYNKFLEHPESKQFQHAPKLLEKLITLEGGNINDCNQEKVWSLFKEEQGGVFVENFGHYLNRGGNDWRVYNKFLEEFKGDLSPYASSLFIRLISLGEEKLLMKFTSTGVDLTQAIEELKSGKLTLPTSKAKASSAKLESLSRMIKIKHPLTTEKILFLIAKSDKEIIDFCFTENNEDLKIEILLAYKDKLSVEMRDSLSRALRIKDLTSKYILFLIQATDRQIIDFCLKHDNEASMIEILKAYKNILLDLSLLPQEILTLLKTDEVAKLLREQIMKVSYKTLFETIGQFENPAKLVIRIYNLSIIPLQDILSLVQQYPWARKCLDSISNPDLGSMVYLETVREDDGSDILALGYIKDKNFNNHQPTDKPYAPQERSRFSEESLSNFAEKTNVLHLYTNSATRVVRLAKEPNVVDGSGLLANIFLLSRHYKIGRVPGNKYMTITVAGIRALGDFYDRGLQTALTGFLSNLVHVKFNIIPRNAELYMKAGASLASFANSIGEFMGTITPYFTHKSNKSEQCEILLFIAPNSDPGTVRAISDNVETLRDRGYDTFLFNAASNSEIKQVALYYDYLAKTLETMQKTESTSAYEQKLIGHAITTFKEIMALMLRPNFFKGLYAYNVGLPENTLGDKNEYIAKNAKKICANGKRKQIFLAENMQIIQPIQAALRKENFKITTFTVWETENICTSPIESPLLEKEVEQNIYTYKCPIRNASLGFLPSGQVDLMEVATKRNLEDVIILDSYKHPRLNSTKAISSAILNRINPSAKSSKPQQYFEMTPNELQEAAMIGNEDLQYSLGNQLLKDDKLDLALQWYRRGAAGGHVKAKVKLAELLSAKPGLSTDPDDGLKEARRWAQEAVNEGSIDGNWALGMALEYQDDNLLGAEELYSKAAENGHGGAKNSLKAVRDKVLRDPRAQHDLGVGAKRKGKLDEAEDWFRKSAEQGFGRSQYELAVLLFDKKNFVEAKIWAKKASDNDVPGGHFLLGSLLMYDGDFVAAKSLLLLSVEKGYEHAQDMITIVNQKISEMTSAGLNPSDSNSFALLQLASDGNMKAQHDMAAELLQKGKTQPAIYWYREAAKQEFPPSQTMLAVLLVESGNRPEAKKWAEKAANHGFIEAQKTLGKILEEEGDFAGAQKWYREAMDQGSKDAEALFARAHIKLIKKLLEGKSTIIQFDSKEPLTEDTQSDHYMAGQNKQFDHQDDDYS